MTKGKVIAFDGPDGVGKTTQIELAAEHLRAKGRNVHVTRFSGGTAIGRLLREVSLSDTPRTAETDLYISLAMGADLATDLQKRKADGEICLVDRSPITMLGYNVYGSELADRDVGNQAVTKVVHDWQLDALLYLNAPQEVLDSRRAARTDKPLDYFEKLGTDYHKRVRQGYEAGIELIKAQPDPSVGLVVIDATGTIEQIQASVEQTLDTLL